MMKLLLKLAITAGLIFSSIIMSCVTEKCPPVLPYFEVSGLESTNLRFTFEGGNPWETVVENDN